MADREISQFATLAAGSQSSTMYLPIVDTSLGHVAGANLKITLNSLFFDLGLNTSDGATGMTGLLAAPAAAVAGKLKWYYNNSTKQWLASIDAGSYYSVQRSIAAGLTAGWLPYVDTGGILNGSANATLDSNGSLGCTFLNLTSSSPGLNTVAEINDSTATDRWEIRLGASNQLIFNDFVNNKDVITLTPGATPVVQLNGTLRWLTDNSQDIGLINSGRARTAYIGTSVIIGRSSNTTGVLTFNNSTNTNQTSFQAGAASASRTYTWPLDFGAAGSVLTDAAGNGTLSWAVPAGTIGGSIAVNQVAYGSGANTIQGNANFIFNGTGLAIGTSAPSAILHVYTTSSTDIAWFERFGAGASSRGKAFIRVSNIGYTGGTGGDALWASDWGFGFQVNNQSSLATAMTITNGGLVGIGATNPGAQLQLTAGSASTIGQIIKLAPAQTADALQVQNSSGTVLTRIFSDGAIGLNTSTNNYVFNVGGASKGGAYFGITVGASAVANDILYYGSATVTGAISGFNIAMNASGLFSNIFRNYGAGDTSFAIQTTNNAGAGGDPYIYFLPVGASQDYTLGIDTSDSGYLKIGPQQNPSGGGAALIFNSTGAVFISGKSDNKDIALNRNGAGIAELDNGTLNTYRDLRLRYIGVNSAPTSGVLSLGGASQSGAYISLSTSSQAINDKLISVAMAGSITGTLYAADISMTATVNVLTRITNTENATSTSNCELRLVTGGASGGDPFIHFNISGNTDWSIGADNSDSDKLVIAASSALGTSNALTITTAGLVTLAGSITITGKQKNLTVSTGAGSALLGANSPAATLTAPFEWINVTLSDGSTGYVPAWK